MLSALGLKANATKRVAWRMTAKLAMVDLDASGHTIDAVAAAIAGAGRLEAA